MLSLTEQIKQKALEIGFHKVGVVPAAPLENERLHLEEWLARGYHADMQWMEREPEERSIGMESEISFMYRATFQDREYRFRVSAYPFYQDKKRK